MDTLLLSTAASKAPDAGDVRQRLSPDHPRLLASRPSWEKIKAGRETDALFDAFLQRSEAEARAILPAPPVVYKKDGRRLLHVSRVVARRVLLLALHYHLTGESVFAKRADEEMQAVSAFADWNPSHFLDVGEMCFALAVGYDWLYDALPTQSRKTIEAAIVEKALVHGLTPQHWQTATNNWNAVCWAGLTLGALAIADVEPEAAAIIQKAVQNNGLGLTPYAPDGVYPEGAMYWGYGTSFQVILLAGLQSALGTDFGLSQSPGFLSSGSALLQQLGPTGAFFNFSDNTERPQTESAMWWFAAHTLGQPRLLEYCRTVAKAYADAALPPQPSTEADRLLPLAALWWTPSDSVTADSEKEPLFWYGKGSNPIVVFRSAWNDTRAAFLALKGGSAGESHGHMDAGSFVYEANGVRWACDLGMQNYLSLESVGVDLWNKAQNGQRWDVFRLGPFSHNTLTINNQKHQVDGAAKITHFGETNEKGAGGAIVDLSPVFAEQARSVLRGFAFDAATGGVLIKDEIAGLSAGDTVRWAMLTRAEIAVSDGGQRAVLTQNGESLHVSLHSSVPTKWEAVSAETPPNDYDAPNPGARLLAAHFTAPASGELTSAVVLQPGVAANSENILAQVPLTQWPLPPVKIA